MKKLYNLIDGEVLKRRLQESSEERATISFYKYVKIANPTLFRNHLYILLDECKVLGRIYVATEGINAQISVPSPQLEMFKSKIFEIDFLKGIRLNFAIEDNGKSFFKLKIKVRSKIVADGLQDAAFDSSNCGIHLNAKEFNELSAQENTIVVDMRNHYESEVGHMKNALLPDVVTFRESLPIVAEMLEEKKDKNIIMYCTGGIRCEKASAYMKYKGFDKVFQLNGGIIEYARQVKEQNLENKFLGKNFVFDERLGEKITKETISLCHQCGAVCDNHVNCLNDQCHILFIQCVDCAKKYQECCSQRCQDFYSLPTEEQNRLKGQIEFNGSRFSKGRYKALGLHEKLVL